MECLRVAKALLLSAIPLTASAQTPQPIAIETALPPFQFLQKPGPYPVGLGVVNQYDPSRKFPVLAGDHSKPAESDKGRPLQTLIWYPAQPNGSKPMNVGDYVALADTEISFGAPDQEHNKGRTRLKSSFEVPLWAVRDARMAAGSRAAGKPEKWRLGPNLPGSALIGTFHQLLRKSGDSSANLREKV